MKSHIELKHRTFGQYLVELKRNNKSGTVCISIAGNTNSNHGIAYYCGHEAMVRISLQKQVIGMEWEYRLTKSVKTWIYKQLCLLPEYN